MRLVDSVQMQEMDRYTIEEIGIPGVVLMENAARGWVDIAKKHMESGSRVFVFCGSGNNGGDGYAIARNLINMGYDCMVVAVKPPKSADCKSNATIWRSYGDTMTWDRFLESEIRTTEKDIVIDAVLGTGIESEIRGDLVKMIPVINELKGLKLAVDMPSGISASTGDLLGVGIVNQVTITFQKEKVGQHLYPGRLYSGETICCPITIWEQFKKNDQEYYLITKEMVGKMAPSRNPDSYKNQYGHLMSWCGATGTLGASYLAGYAALKVGTGLITSALPEGSLSVFLAAAPELMTCSQECITADNLAKYDAYVLGCGLGRDRTHWERILPVIKECALPAVFDADAFYGIDNWNAVELQNKVLTPHPGEFSKMTGNAKPANNSERMIQGLEFTAKHKTTLVLKGAPTLIFTSDGSIYINSTGNSGMSTAGSGDVLSGIIGGLLAQGLSPESAAILGVWLHGKSGDLFVADHCQEYLTATSLIKYLNQAINYLKT